MNTDYQDILKRYQTWINAISRFVGIPKIRLRRCQSEIGEWFIRAFHIHCQNNRIDTTERCKLPTECPNFNNRTVIIYLKIEGIEYTSGRHGLHDDHYYDGPKLKADYGYQSALRMIIIDYFRDLKVID
jgi:hypothetical protein